LARYADIMKWKHEIAANNSDIVTLQVIGKTLELRDLTKLTIRTAPRTKAIWLDAGIHAREWLSPCTCTWIVDRLLKDFRNGDANIVKLLNHYELHVLCLVNPDGYEHSHTTQRLWRKNRRVNSGSTCMGVDLNRNCDQAWMHSGASLQPCTDIYAGSAPDSEPETRAYQAQINQRLGSWVFFITMHTYGQWWLTPWGHNTTLPTDYSALFSMGTLGKNALKLVHGIDFTVGSSSRLLYDASGSSCDWAKGKGNVPYSYTLELRPGAGTPDAAFGFLIPEDRCPFSGEEVYAGLTAMFISAMNQ